VICVELVEGLKDTGKERGRNSCARSTNFMAAESQISFSP
jgi:hypothetical protein